MATAVLEDLERFEMTKLYIVSECQAVVELDSPAPGCERTVATRVVVYEFFSSEKRAQEYIQRVRENYLSGNRTLKLVETGPRAEESGPWLTGQVDHHYSHDFEITHHINSQSLPTSELPGDLESLLNNPKKRVINGEDGPYFL